MRSIFLLSCLSVLVVACQPPVDNSANENFEKNSATVMKYLEGFQNESLDYENLYAEDAIIRGTSFGSKDTLSVSDIMENDQKGWARFDFEIISPINLLPGVSVETKMPDGSVRYYADWEITLPATDSTEARSGTLKLYESFDFNEDGKIVFHQYYGDFGGLGKYLKGGKSKDMASENDEDAMESEE